MRREEVAQLAGVSVDYYVRLERGRTTSVSAAVLNAIAHALQLNDTERNHMFALANPTGQQTDTTTAQRSRPGLLRVLENITDVPALLLGHHLDVLAVNHLGRALYGDFEGLQVGERNMGRWWSEHDVYQPEYGSKRYHHPFAGDLTLGFEAFRPVGEPDQTLGLYTVEPGSPSENALRMLVGWTGRTRADGDRAGAGVSAHPQRPGPGKGAGRGR
ncbi:helix-turn-helix domain-containing protein [Streptomyces sp. NPDC058412]|uniref:helix-turn-helix domain-containing protein n=1 Tax=Streptomyces sp. NPDC058412 TaxID=3346486 RepID=UPI00365668DB